MVLHVITNMTRKGVLVHPDLVHKLVMVRVGTRGGD